jgi:riboflavin biosynthesis pyrimidine reductase
VLVTGSGQVDVKLPIFQKGEAPVLIATTVSGAEHLQQQPLPPQVEVAVLSAEGELTSEAIMQAVAQRGPAEIVLSEGGPRLITRFLAAHCLDELFLTLAPQVAGRTVDAQALQARPALAMGSEFAPTEPNWAALGSLKRAHDHLFMRYLFTRP